MTQDERNLKEHDALYRSLRENLVPSSVWFNRVQQFESLGQLTFYDMNGGSSLYKNPFYIVPYQYKYPIYIEMLHDRHPKMPINKLDLRETLSFGPQDLMEWEARLKARMEPYSSNALHDRTVTELDSSYDIGLIIHTTGGMVYPFTYEDAEDIQLEIMPEQTLNLLSRYGLEHNTAPNPAMRELMAQTVRESKLSQSDGYFMYYQVKYYNRTPTMYGCFNWRGSLTLEETHELTRYMRLMFSRHAKCFVVP